MAGLDPGCGRAGSRKCRGSIQGVAEGKKGLFWGHCGPFLSRSRVIFGFTWESFWHRFGISLGRFGIVLNSISGLFDPFGFFEGWPF